ncbi:MAG: cystatin domain-containing protein [Verrucomicrobiota bacterium]
MITFSFQRRVSSFLFAMLFATACPVAGLAQKSMPGGYSVALTTDKGVLAAAAFAMNAEEKALQKNKQLTKLELVKILRAQQQVVAGVNYRMTLKVRLNGKAKEAESVVWYQAWRKPDPYQLTSWVWK